MKRQVCSYDMVAVPSHAYTLTDGEGDIYLCNPRCLCIWAVLLVTKSNLPEGVRERSCILTGPSGTRRSFDNRVELAPWAAAIAFGKPESEWLSIGQELK